jgi:hypothetical protein
MNLNFDKIEHIIAGIILTLSIVFIWFIGRFIYKTSSIAKSVTWSFIISVILTILYPFSLPLGGSAIVLFFLLKGLKKIFSNRFKPVFKNAKSSNVYIKSSRGTIKISNIFRGILVCGGAGSGKSKSIFYPLISQLIKKDFCGIIYDFKSPELSEYANACFTDKNKTSLKFLDFKNIKNSEKVNPLSPKYVTKQSVAFELATTLINNLLPESIKQKDYWTRSCISVTAGAIWYLRKKHPSFSTLPHLIAMILSFPSGLLIEKLSSDNETAGMISSLKEAYDNKAESQIAGVVGTLKNAIAQLNLPEIFYLLSSDDINLDLNNKENPVFLCIGNDSTLSATYAPAISLIISACVNVMNQPNKHKSAILLDEAPTIYIPGIEQIPATARSNKIATIFGLQDISQLTQKYGEDKTQVLLSNLGNQFYGRTVNQKSANVICSLFGKHDVKTKTKSKSTGASIKGLLGGVEKSSNNKSYSESYQLRSKLDVSDLTNMKAGVFSGLVAEGNVSEFINTKFKQVKTNYKPFEKILSKSAEDIFQKVYRDIELLNGSKELEKRVLENKYKINLK